MKPTFIERPFVSLLALIAAKTGLLERLLSGKAVIGFRSSTVNKNEKIRGASTGQILIFDRPGKIRIYKLLKKL